MVTDDLLKKILPLLPRYSEEGSNASYIEKQAILETLINESSSDRTQAIQTTIEFIERILTNFCVLEEEELKRGVWKFISHPAQLCALSVLHVLSDHRQRLFPPNFWQTAGVGEVEKQKQKKVLETFENNRYSFHLDGTAIPIRFVHVAWGIIKLNNNILFHKREAIEYSNEYGLIGGRLNFSDLQKNCSDDLHDLLKVLQSPPSRNLSDALETALHRECEEEANLLYTSDENNHYTVTLWRDLKNWKKCMGAAPNYALTQYFFRIYQIHLTTIGHLALCQTLENSENFIECTLDEVKQGKTIDGAKTLRINAIYDDFPEGRQALANELKALPSSYINNYRFNDEKDSLIFSLTDQIFQGEAGKEKVLPISLTSDQKYLLTGLAAHGKGFNFQCNPESVVLHKYGWVMVDDQKLILMLTELSDALRKIGKPYMEVLNQCYFRFSLKPEFIFFDPKLFCYQLKKMNDGSYLLNLKRKVIITSIGKVSEFSGDLMLTHRNSEFFLEIRKLGKILIGPGQNESSTKLIRSAMMNFYQTPGLRLLLKIREKHGSLSITECP